MDLENWLQKDLTSKKMIMGDDGLDYTETEFISIQQELELWEDQGRELGRKLRQVSQWAKEARDKLETLCDMVYGHTYLEDGMCEHCAKEEPHD